ncbi:MAG TPA: corrinoid protein [Acidobacteriota bacterium]|nr:corrinoid protein [Acidobacteriota bacterium]
MFQEMQDALLKGSKADVETLVERALAEGVPAARILNEGLIPGMETVGVLFRNSEIFIPEVLVAARAMNAGLTRLEPVLVRDKVQPRGVVVIGTAKGDLHDIGKNLVAMMLKGAGYRIVDLGIDVAPEKYIEAARAEGAGIIACSALLTTTMAQMKTLVEAVRAAGLEIPVIIGGAPVTRDFADRIGAEGFAADAAGAAEEVARLLA